MAKLQKVESRTKDFNLFYAETENVSQDSFALQNFQHLYGSNNNGLLWEMLCIACHKISILLRQGYFVKDHIFGVWKELVRVQPIRYYAFRSNLR